MTPRDFCYWLMGRLELGDCEHASALTEAELNVIRQHLQLVLGEPDQASRYPHSAAGAGFCNWLDGFLSNVSSDMPADKVDAMKRRLSDTFRREIDPRFANSAELQDIHDGKPPQDDAPDDSGLEAMC